MTDSILPNASPAAAPRLIAWEVTRSCNLACAHCRASALSTPYANELSTAECYKLVDQISEVGRPILILTGGEPLLRRDLFDIAAYASGRGFRVVIGTNGTLVTAEMAHKMTAVPVSRISVSLDFPDARMQDEFRGAEGAYRQAVDGIFNARAAGIEVQINCTVTRKNAHLLPALVEKSLELGAVAFHPFLLVPTGRGKGLAGDELTPEEYEATLRWICKRQAELSGKLTFKPTDAPHYSRIARQCGVMPETGHGGHGLDGMSRGCLAGTGFCFISHTGRVQGCGYLDIEAGNIREQSFAEVWQNSLLFNALRDISLLKGKCGACEYKKLCGGCRARAYESTGDYLAAEPYCVYEPRAVKTAGGRA
jgi:AdoMet-dependent heme synthase